jgi:YidC/Oxa1 family membrane protein insertase
MSPFAVLDPAVRLADALVLGVSHLLPWPGGGAAVLVGVALLTVAVRAALLPLSVRAFRATRARAALAPEIKRLRRRHRGDPARLAQETTEAYRRAGVSPFAGLGPGLLQLPVVTTVYRVLVVPTVAGHPNAVITASLLGGQLSSHWVPLLSSVGLVSAAGAGFALMLVVLAALAWASSRQVRAAEGTSPTPAEPTAQLVARLGRLLPYGTVAFAALAPVGVAAYLVVTTAWTVAERALMPRLA